MEKDKIREQIQNLPKASGFLVGYNEMAKDLSEVMREDEVVEGVTIAYEKGITHVVKNTRMMRSFMAVTNRSIYILSRGRMILNTVSMLDKMIEIPRRDIIEIREEEIPTVLKLMYDAELKIFTRDKVYEVYMGANYKEYLPQELLEIIQQGNQAGENQTNLEQPMITEAGICPSCGYHNVLEAKYCNKCGTLLPKLRTENIEICPGCNCEIEKGAKFCPNCGTKISEQTKDEKKICLQCGQQLDENVKFCPNCGKAV